MKLKLNRPLYGDVMTCNHNTRTSGRRASF